MYNKKFYIDCVAQVSVTRFKFLKSKRKGKAF